MALTFLFLHFNQESSIISCYLNWTIVGVLLNPEIFGSGSQVKYYSGQIACPKNTPSINALLRLPTPKSLSIIGLVFSCG
jgi:hypothetical protein